MRFKVVLEAAAIDPIDSSIECVDCGGRAKLTEIRKVIDGRKTKEWFRICECGARYGATSSGRATSMPADGKTRSLRAQAHEAFDRLWRGIMAEPHFLDQIDKIQRNKVRHCGKLVKTRRRQCYAWLSAMLGLERASIGSLNASQCQNVIAICEDATWTQVAAWVRQQKGKDSESREAAIQRRKSKRRARRILGSEEKEWESC
jgi:hypothetical protein